MRIAILRVIDCVQFTACESLFLPLILYTLRLTFTSKECDKSLAKFRANPSDLPVSVANRMVAFSRLDKISLIKETEMRITLKRD